MSTASRRMANKHTQVAKPRKSTMFKRRKPQEPIKKWNGETLPRSELRRRLIARAEAASLATEGLELLAQVLNPVTEVLLQGTVHPAPLLPPKKRWSHGAPTA
mmetsp:Transcript_75670/g.177626  ORF Transcript_75670/g.177626 Transcript_75670/m.177626 type:complete len:103 (-) Transcript_75670:97-405(-)